MSERGFAVCRCGHFAEAHRHYSGHDVTECCYCSCPRLHRPRWSLLAYLRLRWQLRRDLRTL